MLPYKTKTANSAIIGIYTLLLTIFSFTFLYFGRAIIIPLAIAILITFLLAPLVSKLERFVGRIIAVFGLGILLFIFFSIIGYILTLSFIDLTSKLPNYKNNIQIKLESIGIFKGGALHQIWQDFLKLQNNNQVFSLQKSTTLTPLVPIPAKPISVVDASSITKTAQIVLNPLLHLIWEIGLINLLVIFMLLNREDLKGRIIRLLGQTRIGVTTRAMSEAGKRISHYLGMQLIINFSFGILLTLGLFFIGIPNAILWGVLLTILRFIPYLGTWIAAAIPITLSFVISSSWLLPIFTIALYLILDLLSSNFFEPLLYGASTGVSSTALIIAVVFWTLLWGPIGLLLAVPLTVCLVVIGRHVPQLEFLSILLSQEKALEVHEECYHLLLNNEINEAFLLLENYLKTNTLISLYDFIFIPLLHDLEKDLLLETLDIDKAQYLYQIIQDMISETANLYETLDYDVKKKDLIKKQKILCIPASSISDELLNEMVNETLRINSFQVATIPLSMKKEDLIDFAINYHPNVILISIIFPQATHPIREIFKKIRNQSLKAKIILCICEGTQSNKEKLKSLNADKTITSIAELIIYLNQECQG